MTDQLARLISEANYWKLRCDRRESQLYFAIMVIFALLTVIVVLFIGSNCNVN